MSEALPFGQPIGIVNLVLVATSNQVFQAEARTLNNHAFKCTTRSQFTKLCSLHNTTNIVWWTIKSVLVIVLKFCFITITFLYFKKNTHRDTVMAQCVMPPCAILPSHSTVPVQDLATPPPIQLPLTPASQSKCLSTCYPCGKPSCSSWLLVSHWPIGKSTSRWKMGHSCVSVSPLFLPFK